MTKISAQIAVSFLMELDTGLSVHLNNRGLTKVHLVRDGLIECGADNLQPTRTTGINLAQATEHEWCYSCLGNALKHMEVGTS